MSVSVAPTVSVVVPTYNCAAYLPQAVESVLCQVGCHYELLVIDDGSTDETGQVLQPYAPYLRYVAQSNQGVAVARNHGIKKARGEFVAFLDADDYFLPGKLARQVAVFRSRPHLGMVHSGWRRVKVTGEVLQAIEPWRSVPDLNLESWLRWKPVLPSAMLFRRDWLVRSGGFDPRFPPAEDTELVLRLAAMGCEAAWLKQVTVCYRQHEQSAMAKGLPQARSLWAVMDAFFARSDLPERIRVQERQYRYHTLVWIAWYLHRTGHLQEMKEYLLRSLHYTPYSPVKTLVHWADGFAQFSEEVQEVFQVETLINTLDWDSLVKWVQQRSI